MNGTNQPPWKGVLLVRLSILDVYYRGQYTVFKTSRQNLPQKSVIIHLKYMLFIVSIFICISQQIIKMHVHLLVFWHIALCFSLFLSRQVMTKIANYSFLRIMKNMSKQMLHCFFLLKQCII
jgi:hypothetical protein